MGDKYVHDVAPSATHASQFKTVADIPSAMYVNNSTVRLWPGTYTQINVASDGMTFEGVGARDQVIVTGFQFSNTSANTITITNMTVNGTDANAAGDAVAVEVLEEDSTASIVLREVVLGTAQFGVRTHGTGTVTLDHVDATGVDSAVVANNSMTFNYSRLNTSSNSYSNSGNAFVQTVTVVASTSAGPNGFSTTETVTSLIS